MPSLLTFRQTLENALERKDPLVLATTLEVERCVQLLSTSSHPVVFLGGQMSRAEVESAVRGGERGTVYVSKDLYLWLDGGAWTAALKEMMTLLESRESTFWLVGYGVGIPATLQRDIIRINLPLPTSNELVEAAREFVSEGGISLPDDRLAHWASIGRGLTLREWNRLIERHWQAGIPADFHSEIQQEKTRLMKTSTFLELEGTPESLENLGGLEVLKQWLQGRARAFGPEAEAFGLPEPKGLLLLGIQGCGKSLSAKVIASMWGLPLARLDLGQLFRAKGSPEEALYQTLRLAEGLAPMVLWIDEIDKTFAGMESGASDALRRLFGSFITWLQEKNAPVFVVATANEVAGLPPELLRKGRFDEIFFVDLPGQSEREAIFTIHLRQHGRDPAKFDVRNLASRTDYFSGAEIAESVVAALYLAFAEERDLEEADVLLSIQETVPLYFTYEERIKAFREWARERARNASHDKRVLDLFSTGKETS